MRIGIDCRNYGSNFGYMGMYVSWIISYIETLKDTNTYVLFFDARGFGEYDHTFSHIEKVKVSGAPFSLLEQYSLLVSVSQTKIDAMLFFHASIPLFFRKPSILSIPDLADFFYPSKDLKSGMKKYIHSFLRERSIKKAKILITQSEYTKHDIIEVFNISEEKIIVIPPMDTEIPVVPMTETEGQNYLLNNSLSEKFILFVWDIKEYKNIPRLLQAYNNIPSDNSPDLVLLGHEDPSYHEVRTTLIKLNLASRVHIMNPQAKERQFLSSHALSYINPSLYEGSEQSLLIAMKFQIPTISSSLSPLKNSEMAKDIIFFRPMSTEDIGESLEKALKENKTQRKQSKKEYDMTYFSPASVGSKILSLFPKEWEKIHSKKDGEIGKNINI